MKSLRFIFGLLIILSMIFIPHNVLGTTSSSGGYTIENYDINMEFNIKYFY